MKRATGLAHEPLTGRVIAAAIAVHCHLGPGFLESVYGNAMKVELSRRGLPFQHELTVPILYRDVEVGLHRLDLFVAGEIVVELKAVAKIADVHFVIVRSYLRAISRQHGLIINFAKPTIEVRRVRTH